MLGLQVPVNVPEPVRGYLAVPELGGHVQGREDLVASERRAHAPLLNLAVLVVFAQGADRG